MPMPRGVNNSGFDPDAINCLVVAYEDACAELHLPTETTSLKEIVAKKIIAHAQVGERDPIVLREAAVEELRQEAISWPYRRAK